MTTSSLKIGQLVKRNRTMLGLTQLELAQMTKMGTPQFVCNIENGRAKVPMHCLRRVCKVLFIDREQVRRLYLMDFDVELCKSLNIKPKKPKGNGSRKKV